MVEENNKKKSSKKSHKNTEDELKLDELDDEEDIEEEINDDNEDDEEEVKELDDEEIEGLDDEESNLEEVKELDDEEIEGLNDEESNLEEVKELDDEEIEEMGEDGVNEAESEIINENEGDNSELDNLSADSESLDKTSNEINVMNEDEGIEEVHFSEDGSEIELNNDLENGAESEAEKSVSIKELTERNTKKNEIEAAMFIAGRPVSVEELGIKLEMKKKEAQELVEELAYDYMDRTTSIEIAQIGDKYTMQIKPEYTDKVKGFTTGGLIPEAVMRTLTVLALKQPISKALLVKMRGSTAYQHVKFLEDRGFIDSYKKGRSSVLTTTDQFSDTFGLSRDVKTLRKQLVEELGVKVPSKEDSEDYGNSGA